MRSLIIRAVVLLAIASSPGLAAAQDTAEERRVAEAADREDRGEWGWLGLLGLAGLLGLKRRDDQVTTRDRAASVR